MTRRSRQITRTGANLALRVAGHKYLRLNTASARHAEALAALLGDLKGPVMKIGQFLATIPGLLPPGYAERLARLQTGAPPMGPHLVNRAMQGTLGPDWRQKFGDFDNTPRHAASLGQVHMARGHDGSRLACKIQYPGMTQVVTDDIARLAPTLHLIETFSGALQLKALAKEIGARLEEELDYPRETRIMQAFANLFSPDDGIVVPRPVPGLSTKTLITMSWLDGQPLAGIPAKQRNDAARKLFRAFYRPLLAAGILHGDPHPGNYTLGADGSLNLLDFGCVRIFPPRFVQGVVALWRALEADDEAGTHEAFALWGFSGLNAETRKAMRAWAAFVYAPLLDDRVRLIGETPDEGLYGRDSVIATHKALKKAGGVTIPPEFVFMDRAALGLGSVFMTLGAEINWHQEFANLVAAFPPEGLASRQNQFLARHPID